jgi:hypothetical protein
VKTHFKKKVRVQPTAEVVLLKLACQTTPEPIVEPIVRFVALVSHAVGLVLQLQNFASDPKPGARTKYIRVREK